MKKLDLIFIFIISAFSINAQSYSAGLKTGLHFANVQVDGIATGFAPNTHYLQGKTISGFFQWNINDNFSFQPEFGYTEKGFIAREGIDINLFGIDIPIGASAISEFKYIDIPLLGKYTFDLGKVNAYIIGGPSAGYATAAKLKTSVNVIIDINVSNSKLDLTKDLYNRWELAGIIGGGFEIPLQRGMNFLLEGRYQHGLSELMNDPIIDLQLKNKGFGLQIGFSIDLNKNKKIVYP